MAKLPYSRVVNVTLSRNENFTSRRGFGIPLIITNVAVTGKVDATTLVKTYGSMEEVAADFATTAEAYLAAQSAFSQNPRPVLIKIGYASVDVSTGTAANMKTALDALIAFDADWYWLTVIKPLRDITALDGIPEWTEPRNKIAILGSNAAGTEDTTNTTVFAAKHKGKFTRTGVFYGAETDEYPDVALAAMLGTNNFDDDGSHYTAKFKRLRGITPLNKGSAVVQAVTGFVPALGQSVAAGHCANAFVDIGGSQFVVEGSTLTPNVFIDEIHATDWIIARTEEETLNVLTTNKAVPYTDAGMELLASGARIVMARAARSGLIASDLDENGNYAPAVEITIPSVFSVPESQRKARVAPAISIRFRYAGAVHYTTINYTMTF